MSSPFKKSSSTGGGGFFEAKNHLHDLAIVIEAKKILRDQPHEYEGIKSTRDVAVADIACFRNSQDVETATPSVVMKDAQITNAVLVKNVDEEEWVGVAAITQVIKPKRAFIFESKGITPEAEAAAAKWYEQREAKRQAAADDMPAL